MRRTYNVWCGGNKVVTTTSDRQGTELSGLGLMLVLLVLILVAMMGCTPISVAPTDELVHATSEDHPSDETIGERLKRLNDQWSGSTLTTDR